MNLLRAKKYLYQIREEKKEIDELRERIMSVEASMYPSGIRYDLEKVQKIQSNGAADYLELPEQIETDFWVDLPGKARMAYREMEKEALLSLDDGAITALNAAAVLTKLTQIANGFAYDEEHMAHRIHDAKAEALAELVEQADGNVLVFYEFRDDIGAIQKRVPECRVLETEKDIDDWNHGRVRVLLAHPASVGYGLNLQAGGHIIAWYGLTWSLEQYLQANARLHRQGQTKPVLVYRILAKDTVDAQIAESLTRKDAAQEAVLNILKRRREKEYERRGGMGRSDKSASHSDSGAS